MAHRRSAAVRQAEWEWEVGRRARGGRGQSRMAVVTVGPRSTAVNVCHEHGATYPDVPRVA